MRASVTGSLVLARWEPWGVRIHGDSTGSKPNFWHLLWGPELAVVSRAGLRHELKGSHSLQGCVSVRCPG